MIQITNKSECTSCMACFNICPVNAIHMKEDREGFKYPIVDKEKCINCGMCDKICPVKNATKNVNTATPVVIAAWTKDNYVRLDSTSGGIFSELAKIIYREEGYVCGAIYNKEWMVEHYVSKDMSDLEKIRSSKYLQSDINNTFKIIKEKLNEGKKVLMCGSPCQISGLYNYLQKDYENLYTIDFICRGMNSPKVFKGYIESLEKKYKAEIKSIKFKNKTYGWHNFSTKVEFDNGKKYICERYKDSFMIGYLKYNAFMRPSCYNCKFKEFPKSADITLADFWGIENIDKSLDEDKGTSMILINSQRGHNLFEKIKEEINYKEIKSENIFRQNACVSSSVKQTEASKNVFQNIDKINYEKLSKKYFPKPKIMERIKLKLIYGRSFLIIRKILKPIYKILKGAK